MIGTSIKEINKTASSQLLQNLPGKSSPLNLEKPAMQMGKQLQQTATGEALPEAETSQQQHLRMNLEMMLIMLRGVWQAPATGMETLIR